MAQNDKGAEMPFELMKNTQQIASQAALRAKELQQKPNKGPEIPQRGGVDQPRAPEIPPKRLNLKQPLTEADMSTPPGPLPQRNQAAKVPPPIPQKPMSAQNSPLMTPKLKDKVAHATPNHSPHMQLKSQMMGQMAQIQQMPQMMGSPQMSNKNQNIMNIMNSPLFQQRANQFRPQINSPLLTQKFPMNRVPMKALSPEEFGSEDALRGIERGLKNMERAMQEQINMRNIEAQNHSGDVQFNPMEYKRPLGGSISSLDSTSQSMRVMETMRMNFQEQFNLRGIERNLSMDQMQLQAMHGGNGQMTKSGMQQAPDKPVQHNIYRSLDRTLPLELQYSRHRQQQEMDFMRQVNNTVMLNRQAGVIQAAGNREDVRMRRRSSHDETQFASPPNGPPTSNANNNNPPGERYGYFYDIEYVKGL